MDLRRAKIGTLLTIGIVAITGLMISVTVYSSYLTSNAQNIIRNSTTRIFDVLTIQRDIEELFSGIDDLEVIQDQEQLEFKTQNVNKLFVRAQETIKKAHEKKIFSDEETSRANEILNKVTTTSSKAVDLKEESLERESEEKEQKFYQGVSNIGFQFNKLRNIRFEMSGLVNEIIIRSDEEFRNAMDMVHRAQILTWIIIGVSLILAVFLAFFLIKSAKKIYELKNEFVNIIAHDLRNPVAAIIGSLDLISSEKNKTKTELGEYLQAVEVSAQKLRSQINNLLEVGRTEAGHVKIKIEPVMPFEVIEESVLRAKALSETMEMKIIDKKTDGKNVYVLADRSKLSDVLDNLISNAIKYNKKNGSVTISTQEDEGIFKISVTDTGHGIPEDQKHKIFKKYSRLQRDTEGGVGGTGLGLYTVKLSMDKMGGAVSFDTKEGEGTTFTVSLKKTSSRKS
ncbi:sensor histidine kinase [Patescibacteria group bacterium]